jgi:tetratricopeptide (TPR) repeat protein
MSNLQIDGINKKCIYQFYAPIPHHITMLDGLFSKLILPVIAMSLKWSFFFIATFFLFFSCSSKTQEEYIQLGKKAFMVKEYSDAEDHFDKAISLDSNSISAYRMRANTRLALGKYKAALKDVEREMSIDPQNISISAYSLRGQILFDLGNYVDAMHDFKYCIQKGFELASNYLDLGMCYDFQKQYDNAIEAYTESIKYEPENGLAYRKRGHAKVILDRYQDALRDLDSALLILPEEYHGYLLIDRGYCKMQLSINTEEALKDFNQAISLKQDNYHSAYTYKAQIFHMRGNFIKALSNFDSAIFLRPEYIGNYSGRGRVKLAIQDFEGAVADFSKALKIDPKSLYSLYCRGSAYAYLSQYDSALYDFNRLLEINPDDAAALEMRGITFVKLNSIDNACKDFHRSVSLGNKDTQFRIDDLCK